MKLSGWAVALLMPASLAACGDGDGSSVDAGADAVAPPTRDAGEGADARVEGADARVEGADARAEGADAAADAFGGPVVSYNDRFRRLGELLGPPRDRDGAYHLRFMRLSADGSTVVFTSPNRSALVGDADGPVGSELETSAFAMDVATGAVERLDVLPPITGTVTRYVTELAPPSYLEIAPTVVTTNGREAVFYTRRNNEGGPVPRVFLRDRAAGSTTVASFDDSMTSPDAVCGISGDGRRVFFTDSREGRAGGPPWVSPGPELWMWDRDTGMRSWIATRGRDWSANWTHLRVSGDGSVVMGRARVDAARGSMATDPCSERCLLVVDVDTLTSEVVVSPSGIPVREGPFRTSSDLDRVVIATVSDVLDLIPGDTTGYSNLYLYDRTDGSWTLIARHESETRLSVDATYADDFTISGDGRFVFFTSDAGDTFLGGTTRGPGLYRYDSEDGSIEILNAAGDGIYRRNPTGALSYQDMNFNNMSSSEVGDLLVFESNTTSGIVGLVPDFDPALMTQIWLWDGRGL